MFNNNTELRLNNPSGGLEALIKEVAEETGFKITEYWVNKNYSRSKTFQKPKRESEEYYNYVLKLECLQINNKHYVQYLIDSHKQLVLKALSILNLQKS